ncbi:hypothetical protein JB92DRAFT_3124790 [Gautieria morchelliformis]|nr:hypothetical protein JB92DRAFT_3124790 [Gautieria morchelliformis]
MSSCVAVPTETQFQVVTTTSESLSTSFSTVVTTLPPTVETSILPCSGSSSNSACSASTLLVTHAAATSTNTVAVTMTVPVTLTTANPIRTLFSTSCSSNSTPTSINSAPTVQPSQSTPTSSSAPPPAASSTLSPSSASVSSLSSPALSSSAFTTLSDGSVVTAQIAVTTTSPGSSTSVVSSSSPSSNPSGTGGGSSSSSKTGPIVGGVVGGVVALLGIIGCIWFFWRRRSKRWDDLVEKEEYEEQRRPRMTLTGEDAQPRPYHYGLVGHSGTPSPPGSPPLGAAELGHSPSNSLSRLNASHTRSRSTSGDAFSSISRSMSDLNSSQVGSIRPWTASSAAASTPLLERTVNHARSPSIPPADLIGVGPGALTPRPQSAGGSGQGGSGTTFGASTAAVPPLPISSADEKRRLRAALPQGAAPPTPQARAIESASPPVPSPRGETREPPMRRDPKRPPRNASTVTVHVDGGPAAEPDPRSPPGSSEPPAYSPT